MLALSFRPLSDLSNRHFEIFSAEFCDRELSGGEDELQPSGIVRKVLGDG